MAPPSRQPGSGWSKPPRSTPLNCEAAASEASGMRGARSCNGATIDGVAAGRLGCCSETRVPESISESCVSRTLPGSLY